MDSITLRLPLFEDEVLNGGTGSPGCQSGSIAKIHKCYTWIPFRIHLRLVEAVGPEAIKKGNKSALHYVDVYSCTYIVLRYSDSFGLAKK